MTRIAILSDIHGNLPAFEAVQADLRAVAPDQVIVNGDVVNRGPQTRECVAAVRAAGWPVTFGNHEELILTLAGDDMPDEWRTGWWLPSRCAAESLDADALSFLRGLPHDVVVDVPRLPAIRVVHGSMRALNDGLGFWMTDDDVLAAIESAREPIVVGAHTHRPFQRRVGDRWALNSGAVGAPFNGNPCAQYLLLFARKGAWRAEFRSVPYDRQRVYDVWKAQPYYAHSAAARVFEYEVATATFHLGAYEQFCAWHELPRNDLASFEHYQRRSRSLPHGRSRHDEPRNPRGGAS